jgi:hypothetical protein
MSIFYIPNTVNEMANARLTRVLKYSQRDEQLMVVGTGCHKLGRVRPLRTTALNDKNITQCWHLYNPFVGNAPSTSSIRFDLFLKGYRRC